MNTPKKKGGNSPSPVVWLRGVAGAIAGAVIGYFLFGFLLNYGLYAGVVPGAFLGIGFGLAARSGHMVAGILCGLVGLIFGFWCDAATNDPPENLISYFQTFDQVPLANKVMITLGGVMAYWFGKGHN